jgi:anaerobic selenocysteine-containing dehydrogenase
MKRGSKLIVFDPKLTWLGGRADVWLQLRCGTDAAMAIALCNHIIHEGLEDKDFVEQWTYGFDEFVAHIKDFTPEKAAEICDVSVELIRETAEKIGKAKNVCLQWGVPIDQQSGGFLTGMAQFDLLALTGNFEKPGTMLAARACFGMGITWMPDPDAWRELPNNVKDEDEDEIMNFDYPALVGMHALSQDMALDAMETEKPYPIKAMWMATNNALSCMSAAPQRLLPALQATEFNVCVELFMTPTVMAAADVVLPACSFAERSGLTGHQPYALSAIVQGISPLGECKSDQQIIWELGEKFNNTTFPFSNEEEFYDFCLKKTDFSFNDMRERTWAYPGFEYRKHEKGLLRPDGQAGFATSTGRYNFYCPEMNYFGLPPLAVYEEPFDSPVTSRDMVKTYPLVLSTGARLWGFFHSEHRQSPSMRRIHPKPLARINPKTAASYGIKQDDYILIENQYGSCKMYAELYEGLREDTVSTDHAWWFPERDQGDGSMLGLFESNVNQLLPMRPGSSGLGNSYKSQLCRISKCEE